MADLWQVLQGMIGPGLRAGAGIGAGYQARDASLLNAAEYEIAGGQAVAVSQLRAADERKRAALLASRAQALAAASGAGATDATVIDIIANIAGEGAYRSELAMYEGKEAQRAARARAAGARYQGDAAVTAGYVNGLTGFGKTFFEKYGGGGPSGIGYGTIDPTAAGADLPY